MGLRATSCARLVVGTLVFATVGLATISLAAQGPSDGEPATVTTTIEAAQRSYYMGHYESAATQALTLRTADPESLAAHELRSAALLFQVRRALGEPDDKGHAYKQCEICPGLMTAFLDDISRGRAIARARLKDTPTDEEALFFLGKLNLNYVWLRLGTLGHKTGWDEYWEGRRSLDAVLKRNPGHVRARVARAWIDYIVDTKVPWAFQWVLGGGNRKKALASTRQAAQADTDFFTKAEAGFALWEMQVREKRFTDAVATARPLARDFPENKELASFLEKHGASTP